jgi:erythromycin esterase
MQKPLLKIYYLLVLAFCVANGSAQDNEILTWLKNNAIAVSSSTGDLVQNKKLNDLGSFSKCRVFGFGEATHHGKEFFDMKIAFFKYLVETQGLRIFMLESDYISGYRINAYIQSGNGDPKKLVGSLGFGIWRTEELVNFVTWLRAFNDGKAAADQIRFCGIDCQHGGGINTLVREFISNNTIAVAEGKLAVMDTCTTLAVGDKKNALLKENYLETLEFIQKTIEKKSLPDGAKRDEIVHSIEVLRQCVAFVTSPSPQQRDKNMAENVLWTVDHTDNRKGFVWAHNLHVAKTANVTPMGYYLKKELKEAYCSVGFDFGSGQLYELGADKSGAKIYNLLQPATTTYASTFYQYNPGNYLIDINTALADKNMRNFLKSNKNMLMLGSDGYAAKYADGRKVNIAEAFDLLIFVRSISPPTYLENFAEMDVDNEIGISLWANKTK